MEGWTKVDSRSKKRADVRQPEASFSTAVSSAAPGPAQHIDPLQAMDAAWRERSILKAAATAEADPTGVTSSTAAVRERLGGVEPQADHSSPRKQQDKVKSRAPKVKRPKLQTAELPRLEPESVQAFLQQLEKKYPGNHVVQLQALVDHLLVTFQNAQHITLPQINQALLDACQLDTLSILHRFVAAKDADAMVTTLQLVLREASHGISDSHNSQSVKAGVLIAAALLVTCMPQIILPLSMATSVATSSELNNTAAKFPSIHFTLTSWLLDLVSRVEQGSGLALAAWLRWYLPALLGLQLPAHSTSSRSEQVFSQTAPQLTGSAAADSIAVLQSLLQDIPSQPLKHCKESEAVSSPGSLIAISANTGLQLSQLTHDSQPGMEPLVSPILLEALNQVGCSNVDRQLHAQLKEQYGLLQRLAFDGAQRGFFDLQEEVRVALDSAARLASCQEQSAQGALDATIDNLIQALQLSTSSCCEAWQLRHRHQIRGSSAILRQLADAPPPRLKQLLSNARSRAAFSQMLQAVQQRSEQIASSSRGWQQAAARESAATCCRLRQQCNTAGSSVTGWLSAALVSAAALAGIAIYAWHSQAVQDFLHRLPKDGQLAGYEAHYAIQAVTARLSFLLQDAPGLWDYSLQKATTLFSTVNNLLPGR
ncbi:hypothetical protein WJX74_008294 [Apatococcus lobatus]|uniref:Transmembrane protein n=1 Tax=Apatococcus lobatus TaxID=904363 RepID=A0AAW1RHI8_9CHLO